MRAAFGIDSIDIGNKLVLMISKVDENINETLEETLSQLADVLFENLGSYEGQIIDIFCDW